MRSLFFAFTLLAASSASAATITFDEVPVSFGYSYVESGGFDFSPAVSDLLAINEIAGKRFLDMSYTDTITFESLSGDNFSVSSLEVFGYASAVGMTFTGYLAGGGTIQQEHTYVTSGWRTITFDSSWNNLAFVEIHTLVSGAPTGIDNVVVSAVPVPAALWLFGSALAALGWARRKQIA